MQRFSDFCSRMFLAAAIIVGAMFIHTQTALAQSQQVVYVDGQNGNTDAPSVSNPGDSWNNAYRFLQSALTRAEDLDPSPTNPIQIWVRGSSSGASWATYYPDRDSASPNGSGSRGASFHMHNNVEIYGGFAGTEAATTSGFRSRNPNLHRTVLSGEINNQSSTDDNSYHVVSVLAGPGNWIDRSARLDGFTITGGKADGTGTIEQTVDLTGNPW